MILSIIICTYRRNELIAQCLDSIVDQINDGVEILVIDNNGSTVYHKELISIIRGYRGVKLLREDSTGLSYARNCGLRAATGRWIAYLDDDALLTDDYIDKVIKTIDQYDFDCFGGGIESWWLYGRPRWLALDYGSKPPLSDSTSLITDGHLWGSNIVIRKSAAVEVGGFPVDIGMKGVRIGYAAENIIQDRLRSEGYRIGYVPDLMIQHLVARPKLKVSWHIRAAYATARDGVHVYPEQYTARSILSAVKFIIVSPIKGLTKWVAHDGYYWENLVIDMLKPWAVLIGKVKAII